MNINESGTILGLKISLAAYKMIRIKFELACKSSIVLCTITVGKLNKHVQTLA